MVDETCNSRRPTASNDGMRTSTLLPAAVILALSCACVGCPASTQPASTQPASTQPGLKEIDVRHGIYLARIETHTTVSPNGLLRSVRVSNKSYGPGDIDPKHERREVRQGKLTPAEMAGLAELFAGWERLSEKPYGNAADGPDVRVRYGDKTVSGGTELPASVWAAHNRVAELVARMPVVAE